jgi:hypothetical protein
MHVPENFMKRYFRNFENSAKIRNVTTDSELEEP